MLNCHKLNGKFKKTITVQTNDPKNPNVSLVCDGQILESIKMTPNRVFFGNMKPGGEVVERTVRLERGDAGPITPKLKPLDSPELSAELKEIVPHERYELIVRGHAQPTSKRINGRIKIETGVADEPEVELLAYGMVPPRVTVSPTRMTVPMDAPESWSQLATVIWNEGGPHKLLEATIDDPGLQAEVQEVNGRWMVRLKTLEGHAAFRGTKRIEVKTDDEKMPLIEIPVMYRRIAQRRVPPATGSLRAGERAAGAVPGRVPPTRRVPTKAAVVTGTSPQTGVAKTNPASEKSEKSEKSGDAPDDKAKAVPTRPKAEQPKAEQPKAE